MRVKLIKTLAKFSQNQLLMRLLKGKISKNDGKMDQIQGGKIKIKMKSQNF